MRCPRILALTTLAFFSFVIFPKSSAAQENTDSPGPPAQASTRVRLILVQGNEKTKEEIILREMKLEQGGILDREVLERDRLRIQNLLPANDLDPPPDRPSTRRLADREPGAAASFGSWRTRQPPCF